MSFLGAGRGGRGRRLPPSPLLRAQARRPGNPRGLVLPFAAGAVLFGLLLLYLGTMRYSMPEAILVIALGTLVIALLPWAIAATGGGVERAWWVSTPRLERQPPPEQMDYQLLRLRRDLRDALERDDRTDEIYPVLRSLAAERLKAHHEIDLETEPERARDVMDPHLWRYLTNPPVDTRKRSKTSLHTAIEGIEKL